MYKHATDWTPTDHLLDQPWQVKPDMNDECLLLHYNPDTCPCAVQFNAFNILASRRSRLSVLTDVGEGAI